MEFILEKGNNINENGCCIILKTLNSHYRTSIKYEIGARFNKSSVSNKPISINVILPPNKLSNILANNTTLKCKEILPPLGWHHIDSTIYHIERILTSAINTNLLHIPLNNNNIPNGVKNELLIEGINNESFSYIWSLSIVINCLNVNEDNSSCVEDIFYSSLVALMVLELPGLIWDVNRGWWVEQKKQQKLSSQSSIEHPGVFGVGLFKYIPILVSKIDTTTSADAVADISLLLPPTYETSYLITHCFGFQTDDETKKITLDKESKMINLTWLPSFSSNPDLNFPANVKQLHQNSLKTAKERLKLIRKFISSSIS